MRYYEITLTKKGATTPYRTWSSQTNGVFNPDALSVEIDLPVSVNNIPGGQSGQSVTIHGVSPDDMKQSQDFAGLTFQMKAGMQKGLPLANPLQSGLIVQGEVFQCVSNWQGVDMSLGFTMIPGTYTADNPGNFVLNWTAGTKLATALTNMFGVVYPDVTSKISISDSLVQAHDEIHHASTLNGIASMLYEITKGNFLGDSYGGVHMGIQGNNLVVFDGTTASTTTQIAWTDMVGQPGWVAPQTIALMVVMRADIQIGSTILMPKDMTSTTGAVMTSVDSKPANANYQKLFKGKFLVTSVRHIGSSRAPDGASWVTVITAVPYV